MAEIQFIQERPLWKDILFYVLCALFPGVGLMFLMIDKNNNTKTNKKNYLVSLISISVITLSFLVFTILFAVNNNFVFIGLSYRKLGLIYFTYYLINSQVISSDSAKFSFLQWRIIKYDIGHSPSLVRHMSLIHAFVGSNPTCPVSLSIDK